jgi:hypothetical protein
MDMHARALAAVQEDLEMARAQATTAHDALKAPGGPEADRKTREGGLARLRAAVRGRWSGHPSIGPNEPNEKFPSRRPRGSTAMTAPTESAPARELRARVNELEHLNIGLTRQVADLERHNKELREAVTALLAPDGDQARLNERR